MVINLDPCFEPFGAGESFKSWIFSGGEIGFKAGKNAIMDSKYCRNRNMTARVIITARLIDSAKIMELLMATDALRRIGYDNISLCIPYVPYARQDRVMTEGESLSLKVFADLINAQKYSQVTCFDIHNPATLGLFDNIKNVSFNKFARHAIETCCGKYGGQGYALISPDAGANKKTYELANFLGYRSQIVGCEKIRDVSTGEIIHTRVNGDIPPGSLCFIVDDLAERGRSFVEIAKILKQKGAGDVNLVVSHGIFPAGCNLEGISRIFTTDSFRDISEPNVTQIKLDSYFLS